MANANLYAALRPHFPARLDDIAIETADAPGGHEGHAAFEPLNYTWRDLERASARIANLFADLALPAGAGALVHVDKSVLSLIFYRDHRDLDSFPTRRPSDLRLERRVA